MSSSKVYDLIVIGAGAAGCFAAITAAKDGKSVLLLEKNSSVGKKILATGNGRCNFTNAHMSAECYHGNLQLIQLLLSQLTLEEILDWFHEIGISAIERDGYYYPASNQAKSVVVAFENAIYKNHVDLILDCNIEKLESNHHTFCVEADVSKKDSDSEHCVYEGKNLLIATGLLNSSISAVESSIFPMIQNFGHHMKPVLPALCGYECSGINFKKLSGIRTHGTVHLYVDGSLVAKDTGELQFNEYGISGIPVFQISALASAALYQNRNVSLHIDFMPEYSEEELIKEINFRINNLKSPLNGLIPDKLMYVMEGQLKNPKDVQEICQFLKDLTVSCDKYRDYKFSQTCIGGVTTEELKDNSLESSLVDGLYFAGELLDIDGICGGYNLHMAWESGYFVGKNIKC